MFDSPYEVTAEQTEIMLASMDRMAFMLPQNFNFPLLCNAYTELIDKKVC